MQNAVILLQMYYPQFWQEIFGSHSENRFSLLLLHTSITTVLYCGKLEYIDVSCLLDIFAEPSDVWVAQLKFKTLFFSRQLI